MTAFLFRIVFRQLVSIFFIGIVITRFSPVLWWYPRTFKPGSVLFPCLFRIGLFLGIQFIQSFHEQQVGNLFDGRERV